MKRTIKAFQKSGLKVSRCAICCKPDFHADICLVYPDPMPLGQITWAWLKLTWKKKDNDAETVLKFNKLGSGDIRFDSKDGPVEKKFKGSFSTMITLYGQAETTAKDSDLELQFLVEEKIRTKHTLQVRKFPVNSNPKTALMDELKVAIQPTKPSSKGETWQTYEEIFQHGIKMASQLSKKLTDTPLLPLFAKEESREGDSLELPISEISKQLAQGRKATTLAKGRTNAFDAFAGKWRGHYRLKSPCGPWLNICATEERSVGTNAGQTYYTQERLGGQDSRAYVGETNCMTLSAGTRDHDVHSAYLIDINTGVMLAAHNAKDKADAQGHLSETQAIGFFLAWDRLVWLQREAKDGDKITYSLSYETIQPDAEKTPIFKQLYYQWVYDAKADKITGEVTTKSAQFKKQLSEAELALEKKWAALELTEDHLKEMVYRRRLEGLPASKAKEFLDKATDAKMKTYLQKLYNFLEQQEALRSTPVGNRKSITFITGDLTDKFYLTATGFFTMNPTDYLITNLRTLSDIRDHLDYNLPEDHKWGLINIVSHASEDGGMTLPIVAVPAGEEAYTKRVSIKNLETAIAENDLSPLSDSVVDIHTTIFIRGCVVGRSQQTLALISKGFGDNEANRPMVRAPKHIQSYYLAPSSWRPGPNMPSKTEQWYEEAWIISFPKGKVPSNSKLVTKFKQQFPNVVINWTKAIAKSGYPTPSAPATLRRTRKHNYKYITTYFPIPADQKALKKWITLMGTEHDTFKNMTKVKEKTRKTNSDGTVSIRWDYEENGESFHFDQNFGPELPSTTADRLAFLKTKDNLKNDLARINFTIDDYTWTFSVEKNKETPPVGKVSKVLIAKGERTIVRVSRELRIPDPNDATKTIRYLPPENDLTHFGEEIPAVPAKKPLGENIDP